MIFVKAQDAQHRFDECKKCEAFVPVQGTCRVCGCLMKLKVVFRSSKCPKGKWLFDGEVKG